MWAPREWGKWTHRALWGRDFTPSAFLYDYRDRRSQAWSLPLGRGSGCTYSHCGPLQGGRFCGGFLACRWIFPTRNGSFWMSSPCGRRCMPTRRPRWPERRSFHPLPLHRGEPRVPLIAWVPSTSTTITVWPFSGVPPLFLYFVGGLRTHVLRGQQCFGGAPLVVYFEVPLFFRVP